MAFIEPWRIAKSLIKLKSQINKAVPSRAIGDDGGIGDKAHQSRDSDHNPQIADDDGYGVVTAYDFTHDPASGMDSYMLAEWFRKNPDKRIKYIISNRKIWNPSVSPSWRRYTQANPHDKHVHFSIKGKEIFFDDDSDWRLPEFKANPSAGVVRDKPILKRGDRGPNVTYLQTLLDIDPADGRFGPQTQAAVIEFQRQHKLVADGVAGGYTWRALLSAQPQI